MSPLLLRHEDPPPETTIIVRGGLLGGDSAVRSAMVNFDRHGFYGISVFAAIGTSIEELVSRTPELSPQRYKQLRSSTVGRLRTDGFPLLATHDWPHFDIVLPDLEEATIARLIACFSEPFPNPGS